MLRTAPPPSAGSASAQEGGRRRSTSKKEIVCARPGSTPRRCGATAAGAGVAWQISNSNPPYKIHYGEKNPPAAAETDCLLKIVGLNQTRLLGASWVQPGPAGQPDFAEGHLRGHRNSSGHPRDVKIGSGLLMVMLKMIFEKISAPACFFSAPALKL